MKKKGKVEKVMHEYKEGKLHSGSKKGPVVASRKQAIAIAMNEAGEVRKKEIMDLPRKYLNDEYLWSNKMLEMIMAFFKGAKIREVKLGNGRGIASLTASRRELCR